MGRAKGITRLFRLRRAMTDKSLQKRPGNGHDGGEGESLAANAAGTYNDRSRRVAWLSTIAIAGSIYYAVAVVVLHALRPEYDPLSRVTSNYAVGPYGYLMTATFFAIAAGLMALSLGLSQTLAPLAQSRVSLALLVAAGVGAIVAGVFPTDVTPTDAPITATGVVHILAGVTAFLCIVVAAVRISMRLDRDPQWRAFRRLALLLAFSILVGFIVSIVAQPLGGRGIGQRIFLGTVLVWLLYMAVRLRTAANLAQSEGASSAAHVGGSA